MIVCYRDLELSLNDILTEYFSIFSKGHKSGKSSNIV